MPERVWHVLIPAGVAVTGEAANTTLRINRYDGFEYDFSDGTFKAVGTASSPTQTATEHDATADPGAYYWTLGSGTIDGIFPAAFGNDGEYRFTVENSGLSYITTFAANLIRRRPAERYPGDRLKGKKVLSEGANSNFVIYEEDGTTVLETLSVRDKTGGAITLSPGIPAQEIPS